MKIIETAIPDVKLVEPTVHGDHRGYFFESFRTDVFSDHGIEMDFVQDNQSKSKKGILRGLHFQQAPFEQGKLVRVVQGAIIDVAVDIRKSSPTYGKHVIAELNTDNHHQLWVPPGFAHGFLTLQDDTIVCYKCTNYYHQASEGALRWNSLGIEWGITDPILSDKDKDAVAFSDFISPF